MKVQKLMKTTDNQERLELYQKYIDQLLAEGKAYKSYVTEEELAAGTNAKKQPETLITLTNTLV